MTENDNMRLKLLEQQLTKTRENLNSKEPHPEYVPVISEKTIVLTHPDVRLRTLCEAVPQEHFGTEFLEDFITRMKFVMIASKGVGLAAPQIGVCKRIFIAQDIKTGEVTEFINPTIEPVGDHMFAFKEGCLSLPEVFGVVRRPKTILVEWYDIKGEKHSKEFSDLNSTIIQHENDHLDGIEFFDKVSKFSKQRTINKLKKTKAKLLQMS